MNAETFITSYESARWECSFHTNYRLHSPRSLSSYFFGWNILNFLLFIYPFARTIATAFSYQVMFYFEYYSFFVLLKTSVIPHRQD